MSDSRSLKRNLLPILPNRPDTNFLALLYLHLAEEIQVELLFSAVGRAIEAFGRLDEKEHPMRWLNWASALGFLLVINAAFAYAGCPTCGGNDMASYRSYRGPACFSPPGYGLAPGCCECPPSACDNAWDGYCEEKAKWQAFFARVGTPRVHYHGCPSMLPAETCSSPPTTPPIMETQPKPVAKSTVSPSPLPPVMSPSKATSKSDSLWFR